MVPSAQQKLAHAATASAGPSRNTLGSTAITATPMKATTRPTSTPLLGGSFSNSHDRSAVIGIHSCRLTDSGLNACAIQKLR